MRRLFLVIFRSSFLFIFPCEVVRLSTLLGETKRAAGKKNHRVQWQRGPEIAVVRRALGELTAWRHRRLNLIGGNSFSGSRFAIADRLVRTRDRRGADRWEQRQTSKQQNACSGHWSRQRYVILDLLISVSRPKKASERRFDLNEKKKIHSI